MNEPEVILLDGEERFLLFEDDQGWRVSPEDDPAVISVPYSTREALLQEFYSEYGPEFEEC